LPTIRDQTNSFVTYFDHNATSPLLPQARAAWLEAEDQFPGNPSSPHRLGARAEHVLDSARQRLAVLLGCSALDVVWTSGATEACNAVLHHAAAMAESAANPAARVCVSALEHPAVRESAEQFFPGRVDVVPVTRDGRVELSWLAERLARERPVLVAMMAVNNETGVLQPWREAQVLCAARGVPFFCDATQWCGRLPVSGLGGCDFVAGSAHKFGGPRGVGFLKTSAPAGRAFVPLLVGGKQQDRRRAGTENVPGILAALAALEWCEVQIAAGGAAARLAVRERFERDVCAALPGLAINGGGANRGAASARLWNTVSVVMPSVEADCRVRWVVKLDKAGFAVSTGSACASGSEEPSPVLTAMGLAPGEAARALRFSSGWLTPETAWDELRGALVRVAGEITSGA
jgi:cysteine desulfurase